MNNKIFSSPVFRFIGSFLVTFLIFYILFAILRFFVCTNTVYFTKYMGYIALAALTSLATLKLWQFDKKLLFAYFLCFALYALVLILKLFDHLTILDREIIHTMCLSTFFVGFAFTLLYCSKIAKSRLLGFLGTLLFALCFLSPLIMIGFFIISGGHVLSTDLIMTLFQTNLSEIRAYLADQNLYLWSTVLALIFLFTSLSLIFLWGGGEKKKSVFPIHLSYAFLLAILWSYICIFNIFHMTFCFVLSLPLGVYKSLEAFEEYQQTREVRAARLADLKNLLTANNVKGVYVVVIGESTNRDHMHAFGYARENTPWLDQMAKNPLTILYPHAYSNHTHTIPALQYALTSLNQYQNIPFNAAYSITEVAKASGFDTYWISNQEQFARDDIPIATIAAVANHRAWINDYIGEKIMTTSYDEKLVDFIPAHFSEDKVLLFIHLMGCHLSYHERYSPDFEVFHGTSHDDDIYDNAILHNDYVLQKLYNKVKDLPQFMAFVYFSDHGEDVRDKYRHDASKFTFSMSHIPLFMIFSEKFKATRPDVFQTLSQHRQSYVTNDLVYNFMLTILGINNIPYLDKKLDIASDEYAMDKETLLTVHGKKRLADDF